MSDALRFIREHREQFISSSSVGSEIASKVAESALTDGANYVSIVRDQGVFLVGADISWSKEIFFWSLVPYPELAINTNRPEILVSSFSKWFLYAQQASVLFEGGSIPLSLSHVWSNRDAKANFTLVFEV